MVTGVSVTDVVVVLSIGVDDNVAGGVHANKVDREIVCCCGFTCFHHCY